METSRLLSRSLKYRTQWSGNTRHSHLNRFFPLAQGALTVVVLNAENRLVLQTIFIYLGLLNLLSIRNTRQVVVSLWFRTIVIEGTYCVLRSCGSSVHSAGRYRKCVQAKFCQAWPSVSIPELITLLHLDLPFPHSIAAWYLPQMQATSMLPLSEKYDRLPTFCLGCTAYALFL